MSIESMVLVLYHSRAVGTAKVVALGIANHDGDGGSWPAIATLAKYANVTPRAVSAAVAGLVELGELVVHVNAGGTHRDDPRHRTNRYELLIECPPDCDGRHSGMKPASSLQRAQGMKSSAPRDEVQRAQGMKPASREPSYNPTEPSKSLLDESSESRPWAEAEAAGAIALPTFDTFWSLYPRRVSKQAASTKWRTLTTGRAKVSPQAIMDGLLPWLRYWQAKREPEFVPYPATWLNQRRWETPPDAPPARRGARAPDDDRGGAEGVVNW